MKLLALILWLSSFGAGHFSFPDTVDGFYLPPAEIQAWTDELKDNCAFGVHDYWQTERCWRRRNKLA